MSPSEHHCYVQSNLIAALKRQREYTIFSELSLWIDKDYVPDICIYPKRTIHFGGEDTVKMTEMPLTAIEILSPSQTIQDALDKFKVYFRAGIKSCWLVVPATMTVNLYTDLEHVTMFHTGEVTDPASNVKVQLDEIFE